MNLKKLFMILFVLFIQIFNTGNAFAANFVNSAKLNEIVIQKYYFKDKFKLGLETAQWNYRETVSGKNFMSDSGTLNGFGFAYQDTLAGNTLFWDYNLRYLTSSSTEYKGGNSGGEKFNLASKNSITEHSFRIGVPFLERDTGDIFIKPYVGLSFRKLENPKDKKAGSYDRESNYTTIPLGSEVIFNLNNHSTAALDLRYDLLLRASTESKLSQVDSAYKDIDNKQKKGSGIKIGANYTYYFTNQSLVISTYYRKWDFEDSEAEVGLDYGDGTVGMFIEPKNTTEMSGINIALGF